MHLPRFEYIEPKTVKRLVPYFLSSREKPGYCLEGPICW